MQQKLRDLLEKEGLKPSQFAEMLGVNPAGISHLLAGRNKPGYDLLQKILRRFPQINPDWLLVDRGPMYRADAAMHSVSDEAVASAPVAADLFSAPASTPTTNEPPAASSVAQETATRHLVHPALSGGAQPIRIVVCYDDGSFESFTPQR